MSSHHFNQPLRPQTKPTGKLPNSAAGVFGALVGTADGPLNDSASDHVLFPLRVSQGEFAGTYQLAFNTESNDHTSVQYYMYDEPITMADVPAEGFTTDASLSYEAMGLTQANFQTVVSGKLRTLVHASAADCDLIAAYGITYHPEGDGLHDIHMHHGEGSGSGHGNLVNKDGALALYSFNRSGQTSRRWFFIKFQTQTLG